jgi:hypothetical protein
MVRSRAFGVALLCFFLLDTTCCMSSQSRIWQPFQKAVTWHWQSWQQKDGEVDWKGIATDLDAMRRANITWARMHIGPEMNEALTDRLIDMAASRDIHFLVLVADTDSTAKQEPPEWLASVAHKYKGRISAWEIGNEENYSGYWSLAGGRVASVRRYVDYLERAYPAIKQANPDAFVLMGGLMGYRVEEFLPVFLHLGGGRFTDGFAIHPYAGNPEAVVNRLTEIEKEIAHDSNMQGKPVWITEIGYYANEPKWTTAARVPDEATKAIYLTQTIEGLRKHGIDTPIFWYNFHDFQPGVCGYSLVLFDLLGAEVPLPAYEAYKNLTPSGAEKDSLDTEKSAHASTCR